MHKPLKGNFNDILGAVAMGGGKGKKKAIELQAAKAKPTDNPKAK
jgi:hypothetical protein